MSGKKCQNGRMKKERQNKSTKKGKQILKKGLTDASFRCYDDLEIYINVNVKVNVDQIRQIWSQIRIE